jgi:hypothetical protein
MNSIEGYAQHPAVSVSNVKLTRAATALVMVVLGISYAFSAMDRQVFPALLGGIRATYGITLAQAGFVSTVFTINVAIFGALNGWFLALHPQVDPGGRSRMLFVVHAADAACTRVYEPCDLPVSDGCGRGAADWDDLCVSGRLFWKEPRNCHGRHLGVFRLGGARWPCRWHSFE